LWLPSNFIATRLILEGYNVSLLSNNTGHEVWTQTTGASNAIPPRLPVLPETGVSTGPPSNVVQIHMIAMAAMIDLDLVRPTLEALIESHLMMPRPRKLLTKVVVSM
jgi:hypothetical protein